MNPQDSGRHGLGERRAETVEGFVQRRCGWCALLFGGCCDLEQSLSAEVWGKSECVLVLHHNSLNVRQTFRLVSIIKLDAGVVKFGS
jgi:hypothetical protein